MYGGGREREEERRGGERREERERRKKRGKRESLADALESLRTPPVVYSDAEGFCCLLCCVLSEVQTSEALYH